MGLIYRILMPFLIILFSYGLGVLGLTIYKNMAKKEVVELNTKEALQASAYKQYKLHVMFDLKNLQEIIVDIMKSNIHDKTIYIVLDNNPGGNSDDMYRLQALKKAYNLKVITEARTMAYSAAEYTLINSTVMIINKDALIGTHTGSLIWDGTPPSPGKEFLPGMPVRVHLPDKLIEFETMSGYFIDSMQYHIDNSKYLTKEQYAMYVKGQDIELGGLDYCVQNRKKLLYDTPTYCVLKGLDYPGGVEPVE